MKFTLSWLEEYLDTKASIQEISDTLTAIGLEVEKIDNPGESLAPFKIAKILKAEKHPDADKLQVCKVTTGKETLQIVCGAANARAGINVVLAPVGTTIPSNGMKIKAAKIRGVESKGMLCSAAELGIGGDSEGIIEFEGNDNNIGKVFAEVEGLDDPVIEIAITPNRGDCLGVYGIARDLAAAGLGKLKQVDIEATPGAFKSPITVDVKDKKLCPLFIGRYFKNVKNGPSPAWLKRRLESVGIGPISKLVDITNYICISFGRPLHVYDAKKLKGNLKIRKAKKSDSIEALDHNTYQLDEQMIAIADDKKIQALGGVIGSEESGCDDDTTDVFLEVAIFDPIAVAKTGRKLGIHTDSRYRFERQVDQAFVKQGAELASQMIKELCQGEASELVIIGNNKPPKRKIALNTAKIEKLTGINVKNSDIKNILIKLGFTIAGDEVTIPSWRNDVEQDVDITEEVIRIYGYDKIPLTPLPISDFGQANAKQTRIEKARRQLAAQGLDEVVTWSFMDSKKAQSYNNKAPKLQNPISTELDTMRPSIIPNLIDVYTKNAARGHASLSLFEIGRIYHGVSPEDQPQVISGIRTKNASLKNNFDVTRSVDFFDAKQDVENIIALLKLPLEKLTIKTEAPKWYHPGKSASLLLDKTVLAHFGEIHPLYTKLHDAKDTIVGFEIYLDNMPEPKQKKSKAKKKPNISDYQSSERDFAFILDEQIQIGDLLHIVKNADKDLISAVNLFDIYQGENIAGGKKSVAISVVIQPQERTLTDKDIEEISQKITSKVKKELNGSLRE